ncbi:MAG: DUF294 nucleotidyltransferase-like domain-containing protein [Rhodospirillaceae bacterium]
MERQTDIFRKPVRDGMRPSPPAVQPDESLNGIVGRMEQFGASAIVVCDAKGRAQGIVTEHDIARRAAFRMPGDAPAADVMTQPVDCIHEDEYLYHAIAQMRRQGRRHMPVVDQSGVLTGILNLDDTLAVASKRLMDQLDILTREDNVDGLTEVKAAEVDLAAELREEGVEPTEIQALLSHINLDIYRRVIDLNLVAMETEGLGPPPRPFQCVVMGSGGRGESFLFPDQDNGFIIEDYPDDDHTEIDGWFINLAERMTRDLDRVGLPLCKGFVMATNPLWRKNLSQWKEQMTLWSKKRNNIVLRHCDIFFDFVSAFSSEGLAADMAGELRQHVTDTTRGNKMFLMQMYTSDQDAGAALGWFRRFKTMRESDPPGYKGYLNLKHMGTLPLVEGMRLMCLREGLTVLPTLSRISALHAAGILNANENDELTAAYKHLSGLLLRQQIADFKAGNRVTNFVHPNSITRREASILKDSFEAIQLLKDRTRMEFTGNVF